MSRSAVVAGSSGTHDLRNEAQLDFWAAGTALVGLARRVIVSGRWWEGTLSVCADQRAD